MHPVAGDWRERLAGWVSGSGCDVHVVQRETLDIYEYIEVWLSDAGLAGSPDYARRYAEWVDYFDHLGVGAIGMGWLTLRKTHRADPWLEIEDWPHPIEQPIGPAIAAGLTAVELEWSLSDDDLLARSWVLAPDIVEETLGLPGGAGPQQIVHRQQRGFRRAVEVDTALGGILGACDGELQLSRIVDSVADILGADAELLADETVPTIRRLVRQGFLT